MDKMGYSTKGELRGYGLDNANEILEKTRILSCNKVFDGNIFSQILKINLKSQSRGS